MADFRGVDQNALIDSFVRAQIFLRNLKLGATTEWALKTWERNDVPNKVRTARDDAQLADIMRQTGALPLMSLYKDIFVYHAALEAQTGRDDHQVRDLYRDLSAWSAFFDEAAPANPLIDKEVRGHIVLDTLQRLDAAGPEVSSQCSEKLDLAVAETGKKDKKLADWLEVSVDIVRALRTEGEPDDLANWLTSESSAQDACLQKTLYSMCGLQPEERLAGVREAMEQYRIALNNEKGSPGVMPASRWSEHLQSVKRKLQMAMAPFAKVAQVAKIEMFPLSREKDKWSISFYGTRQAAQTAAASVGAFNYSVLDPLGRMVELPPQKLLPPPPPTVS